MSQPDPWYATSPFDFVPGPTHAQQARADLFLIHAKRTGSTVSACGQNATAWKKHWVAFQSVGADRACPGCVQVIVKEGAGVPVNVPTKAGLHDRTGNREHV